MHKFWIILKREYVQVVKKKSFILGIVLTPALMIGFSVLPAMLAAKKSSKTEHLAVIDQSEYHIGTSFSNELAEYKLDNGMPYYQVDSIFNLPEQDTAQYQAIYDSLAQLINENVLKYFLVVKPDAPMSDTGIYLVTNSDNFRSLSRFENKLSNILSSIRLNESNVNLSVDSVLSLTRRVNLKTKDAKGDSIPFEIKYFSSIIFIGIIFGMVVGYGQLVMRSVIEEKNSRIIEVLISSVSPFQLMFGKIIGLAGANFTQMAVWVIIGAGLYSMKGSFNIDSSIDRIIFNPVIVIFFVLYMISGYLLYSTIFALVGSIVNTEKEAQGFVMPITMMMILPFILGIYVIQEPNSTTSVILSMIPLLTPTMMMMRVIFIAPTLTEYSLFSGIVGEALLGLLFVCLAVVVMVWITSKIFRIGILMYGKRPTLPEILKWIRY